MRSTDPKGRLAVIGRDARWQRRLFRLAEQAGLVPEIMSWGEASRIEAPVSGIVVHVAAADEVLDTFRAWAPLGFQSVSIVSLESSPGAAELKAELEALGFERILLARPWVRDDPWVRDEGRYWSELGKRLGRLATPCPAFLPIVANMVGRSDIGFVRMITAALEPPVVGTVERWCTELRVSRWQLSGMLDDLSLPRPKRTLDIIRLALAVHLGTLGFGTLDRVANATSFASGEYLGRTCRRLTGRSFGELVRRRDPVSEVLRELDVA